MYFVDKNGEKIECPICNLSCSLTQRGKFLFCILCGTTIKPEEFAKGKPEDGEKE